VTVRSVEIERRGEVGWILINDYQATVEAGAGDPDFIGVHEGIGLALDELRWDNSVRVVVLTGKNDGEFYRFSRRTHLDNPEFRDRLNPLKPRPAPAPGAVAAVPPSIQRRPDAHEMLMLIEKPVIARVNGDAIGFGSSLIWGCDFIIGVEDAKVAWGHTGLGEIIDSNGEQRGFPWTMTPSYGMVSILYMPPAKAKEFLILSKVYTARELADMNAFNIAVPAEDLDATVDEFVQALLRRPAAVIARTKKLVNKPMVAMYNAEEDLAGAYTTLDLYQQSQAGMMD
jgi:enoyl-CoA hydratase/carnithine racemase